MEYSLAIDRGPYYANKERFIPINLQSIDRERNKIALKKPDNLAALTTFTMTFTNPKELKAFLLAKNLLKEKYQSLDLVIIFDEKDTYKTFKKGIKVPYKCYEKYFDVSKLAKIIYQRSKRNKQFLGIYLEQFTGILRKREYYVLKNTNSKSPDLLKNITDFLTSLTIHYDTPETPYFYGLYQAAMLMARFDEVEKELYQTNLAPSTPTIPKPEEEPQYNIEDDQMRLF